MTYNKGDILVCSTNIYCGHVFNPHDPLIIEGKYEVVNNWDNPGDYKFNNSGFRVTAIDVRNIETNKLHSWVPSTLFIGLDVYREFKLSILENEKL